LIAEMTVEKGDRQGELAIELPVRPLTNAVGTNTAHSTSAIAMIGPDTSSMARRVASIGREPALDVPLDVLHHDDRVVDDDADREDEAEERQRVQREPEAEHHGEGPDQRHRNGDERDDRRAPRLQEHHHDEDDQQNASKSVSTTPVIELRTKHVGS
jgi:hypothetical protein